MEKGNKPKVNPEKLRSTILSMASMFETGRIKKMRDITTMYPTGIVWALGINFGGYMSKCMNPEKFVISDIVKLSNLLSIDIELINKVILKEAQENVQPRDLSNLLPQ